METLTIEQLENQIIAINTVRFLMENAYKGSETTLKELNETLTQLRTELDKRR